VALMIPAGFASATPVDPSVIINGSPHDATPFTGMFDVTLVGGAADVTFENVLSVAITQITVQFQVPLPTGLNTCSSDIFSTCGVQDVSYNSVTKLLTEDFVFMGGGSIAPGEDFSFAAMGFTGANPNVLVSSTPEPATIVLLLTGGALLIGFGRKW
ncbi:MAG: PEP-CTERM sorting domain-containing protein, partial [Candidatus Acidiferrales bacterium]